MIVGRTPKAKSAPVLADEAAASCRAPRPAPGSPTGTVGWMRFPKTNRAPSAVKPEEAVHDAAHRARRTTARASS